MISLFQEAPDPPKPITKIPEPPKAETKTIPALKIMDTPAVKSVPAKIQEPMYTKAATPKVNKVGMQKDRLLISMNDFPHQLF